MTLVGRNLTFSETWRKGPDLGFPLRHAAALTDDEGGLVLIGGGSNPSDYKTSLWYLSSAQSRWRRLPQTLSEGRRTHAAFFVPKELAFLC